MSEAVLPRRGRTPMGNGAAPSEGNFERRVVDLWGAIFCRPPFLTGRTTIRIADRARRDAMALAGADMAELNDQLSDLRRRVRRDGFVPTTIIDGLALGAHVARSLADGPPTPQELAAAAAMLEARAVAVPPTARIPVAVALAAGVAALSETAVIVLGRNEATASHSLRQVEAIYRGFGLSAALSTRVMADHDRADAYAAPVVYCASRQLALDYLRDRVAAGPQTSDLRTRVAQLTRGSGDRTPLLRGLDIVFVEGLDAILLDDARAPLVVTADDGESPVARMSFQRLFRRCGHLAGVTRNPLGLRGELWSLYRLALVRIGNGEIRTPVSVYPTSEQKWSELAQRISPLIEAGGAVVIHVFDEASVDGARQTLDGLGIALRIAEGEETNRVAETLGAARTPGAMTLVVGEAAQVIETLPPRDGTLNVIIADSDGSRRTDCRVVQAWAATGVTVRPEAIVSLQDTGLAELAEDVGGLNLRLARAGMSGAGRAVLRAAWRAKDRRDRRLRRGIVEGDRKLGSLLAFTGQLE